MELLEDSTLTTKMLAEQHGVTQQEIARRIELGKAMVPGLEELVRERNVRSNAQRIAIIHSDLERVYAGKISMGEFWEKHPGFTFEVVMKIAHRNTLRGFLGAKLAQLDLNNPESIHEAAHLTGMVRIDDIREVITQVMRYDQQPITTKRKLGAMRAQFARLGSVKLKHLVGLSYRQIGSEEEHHISQEDIDRAVQCIKEQKGVICSRTVMHQIQTAQA